MTAWRDLIQSNFGVPQNSGQLRTSPQIWGDLRAEGEKEPSPGNPIPSASSIHPRSEVFGHISAADIYSKYQNGFLTTHGLEKLLLCQRRIRQVCIFENWDLSPCHKFLAKLLRCHTFQNIDYTATSCFIVQVHVTY